MLPAHQGCLLEPFLTWLAHRPDEETQAGQLGGLLGFRSSSGGSPVGWCLLLQGVHPAAQHQRLRGRALPHGVRVAGVHQDAAVHRALPRGRLQHPREGGADDQRVSLLRPCPSWPRRDPRLPPALPLPTLLSTCPALPLVSFSFLLSPGEWLCRKGRTRPAASSPGHLGGSGEKIIIVIVTVASVEG